MYIRETLSGNRINDINSRSHFQMWIIFFTRVLLYGSLSRKSCNTDEHRDTEYPVTGF